MSCNECIYLVLLSWSIASSVTLLFMGLSPSATVKHQQHSLFFFLSFFLPFLHCIPFLFLYSAILIPSFLSFVYRRLFIHSIPSTYWIHSVHLYLTCLECTQALHFFYSFFLFGILGFSLLEVLVGILTLPTWISKPTNQAAQSSHASQETLPQNYLFSRGHPPSRRVSLRDRAENPGVACVEQ